MSDEEYLGDGLYALQTEAGIRLRAPRIGGDHEVFLDPYVFEALLQYAMKLGWLEKGQALR